MYTVTEDKINVNIVEEIIRRVKELNSKHIYISHKFELAPVYFKENSKEIDWWIKKYLYQYSLILYDEKLFNKFIESGLHVSTGIKKGNIVTTIQVDNLLFGALDSKKFLKQIIVPGSEASIITTSNPMYYTYVIKSNKAIKINIQKLKQILDKWIIKYKKFQQYLNSPEMSDLLQKAEEGKIVLQYNVRKKVLEPFIIDPTLVLIK